MDRGPVQDDVCTPGADSVGVVALDVGVVALDVGVVALRMEKNSGIF
jgi:hypothetical protein